MKIALVVDKSGPFFLGGYENRAWNLASSLSRSHEVRIYTSLPDRDFSLGGVRFVRVAPTTFLKHSLWARSLKHSILFSACLISSPFDDWRPDFIYVEAIPYFHLPLVRRWIKDSGAHIILNVNEFWEEYVPGVGFYGDISATLIDWLLKQGITASDTVVTVSSATGVRLGHAFANANVQVIPNGIHFDRLTGIRQSVAQQSRFDFVFLGRLVPYKRPQDFVKALGLLKRKVGWAGKAMVIGDGPEGVPLRKLANDVGLYSQVVFTGIVDEETKFSLLSRSRFFVLASEREGFSIVTLEALACGVPAVVAVPPTRDVAAAAELVEDHRNGRLYPAGDVEALSNVLAEIVSDRTTEERMASQATSVASQYDWANVSARFEAMLLSMS